jgi:hypothetical protein
MDGRMASARGSRQTPPSPPKRQRQLCMSGKVLAGVHLTPLVAGEQWVYDTRQHKTAPRSAIALLSWSTWGLDLNQDVEEARAPSKKPVD